MKKSNLIISMMFFTTMFFFSGVVQSEVKAGHWQIDLVDVTLTRGGTSLVLEADGSRHVAYSRSGIGTYYCYCDDYGTWHTSLVDTQGGGLSSFIAMAFNSANKLCIAYQGDNRIRYATNSGGMWQTETAYNGYVEPHFLSYQGFALDLSDRPYIVFGRDDMMSPGGFLELFFKNAGLFGASWASTMVEGNYGEDYHTPSIVFDSCDVPHVVYATIDYSSENPVYELRHSHYKNGWQNEIINFESLAYLPIIDIALSGQGSLYVLCDKDIKYETCIAIYNNGVWDTIDGPNDVSNYDARLAFDYSGNLWVVTWASNYYYDGSVWHRQVKTPLCNVLGVSVTYLRNFRPYAYVNEFGNACVSVAFPEGLFYCEFVPEVVKLARIEIVGPEEVAEKSNASYRAIACYDDYGTADVTSLATWAVEPDTYTSIDNYGVLTTGNIIKEQSVTIRASYIEGQITVDTERAIRIFPIHPKGDLNKDGNVDFKDFAILGGNWLSE